MSKRREFISICYDNCVTGADDQQKRIFLVITVSAYPCVVGSIRFRRLALSTASNRSLRF